MTSFGDLVTEIRLQNMEVEDGRNSDEIEADIME